MHELVLHPATRRELEQFASSPAHALLVVGSEGTGKASIARQLAADMLRLESVDSLAGYPYFRAVAPDGQSISIDAVRELLHFAKLKVAGDAAGIRRVIIIDDARAITHEAQNALLKLLEEPPEDTAFILNAAGAQELLPTVRSRAQQIIVKQPNRQDLEKYFATQGFSMAEVQKAYMMSGGLPGLMHALLHDEGEHPLAQAVTLARHLLQVDTFERLKEVDSLAKRKADCAKLLFVLQQMAHAAIGQSAEKATPVRVVKQWHRVLAAAYDAEAALQTSAQPKLALTNLMLAL
jgi:DNA polymerase III delta subunit-like protein